METAYSHIRVSLATLLIIAATACTDDIDIAPASASPDVRFTASIEGSARSSRAAAGVDMARAAEAVAMTSGATGDSLYLLPEVIDSWDLAPAPRPASRSNMIHSDGDMYGSFNISAYYYTDSWTADKATHLPNYFYFEGATGSSAGGYTMDTPRYWPSTGRMRFMAFAPYDASNGGAFQMACVDGTSGPYIHIEVDADAAKHQDLVVAYSQGFECTGANEPVGLNFKHALSCIQFVMGGEMTTSRIKEITISNVKYRGDMRFHDNMTGEEDASTADANLNNSYYAWDGLRTVTLRLTDDAHPSGMEFSAGDLITDDTRSFLMFPQVVPDSALVRITLARKGADGTWGADEEMFGYISGRRWPAGKIIRYSLNNEKWWQQLQVNTLPAFPPQGGDQYFSITSYDTGEYGEKRPIHWTARYEDPSNPGTFIDERPSWYSFDTINEGSVEPMQVKVTALPVERDHTVDLDAILKSTASQGSKANPYNLSTSALGTTTIGTTANCYIVDRPGWYIIPLVYGNGIEGGSPNATAYRPNAGTANGALDNFVNYRGEEIASPYILTDCASVAGSIDAGGATVVWQDRPNLVNGASVTVDKTAFSGHGGILFEITAADIIQGNSVIGLKVPGSDSEMIWSWHVWVTPFFRPGLDPLITSTIGVTNNAGSTRQLMYLNLGWCSVDPVEIYSGRTSRVQFTAVTDDGRTLSKELTVEQAPFVRYWHGRNTYYQWGRKDPYQPFLRSYEQTWYDSTGAGRWQYPSAAKDGSGIPALKERILNPLVFHTADAQWGQLDNGSYNYKPVDTHLYTNLWDATYNAAPVKNRYDKDAIEPVTVPARDNVKTVYDPCPAGYKVPPVDTFTGFTNTGNDIGALVDSPKNWNGMLMQYDYDCGGDPAIDDPSVYLFYTNPEKTSYIAFPLSGYRDWRWAEENSTAGAAYQMGNYGYSWTAGAASDIEGYYLELRKDPSTWASPAAWIMPLDYFWQLDALAIRPARE